MRRTGADQRADDRWIEHRAPGGNLANGPGKLIAFGNAVLQQVGISGGAFRQQRDRIVGVVVLAEDDDARAGMAFADELARLNAFSMEVGWHANVADHHVRRRQFRTVDEPIVIFGFTDDLQVVMTREHGLDPFANEDAVVGDEDCDRSHALIQHHTSGEG